jgi:TRAP-type C4-dicarboxylate transport system permease small subunit
MPALEISRVWLYAAGPIGCAFMLLYAVRDLMRIIHEHRVAEEPTVLGT